MSDPLPPGPHLKRPGATKIPVAMTYLPKQNTQNENAAQIAAARTSRIRPEHSSSPSLMAPTQSSAAKMTKPSVSKTKSAQTSTNPEQVEEQGHPSDDAKNTNIPKVMERSGTFSKDEPTFGDRTTEIE